MMFRVMLKICFYKCNTYLSVFFIFSYSCFKFDFLIHLTEKLSPECEKRNYLLKFTDQLYEKLGLIQDENKQELCEKYRQILQKLKTRLDTMLVIISII